MSELETPRTILRRLGAIRGLLRVHPQELEGPRVAASAVFEFLRAHFNFRRICATVDPANEASVRILEKLGMKRSERRLDEYDLPEDLYELELR